MGKVIGDFLRGSAGAVSRAKDDVIISLRNVGSGAIRPGDPVFLYATNGGVRGFVAGTTTDAEFVGFAVRVPDKTPPAVDSNQAVYAVDETVDILVRGSIVVPMATAAARIGQPVYVRKSDSLLVTSAGAEGTTVPLPDTYVRGNRDIGGMAEVVVTKRHIQ